MWDRSVAAEEEAVIAALRSGRIGSEAEVDAFEHQMASAHRCRAVTTSSGSTAIELVLRAVGIGQGDTVLVPALTCRSVADAVLAAGARPRSVDVDARRLTIDPAATAERLGDDVRAVIAVDLYGCEVAMRPLREVVGSSDVTIIHDVATSFGLRSEPPPRGVVRVSSLHGSKPFGVGEGGLVLTRDADLARRVAYLRSPGALAVRGVDPPAGWTSTAGFSARMSDLDACLARARAARLPVLQRSRRIAAEHYHRALAGLARGGVRLPSLRRHAFACYPVQLGDATERSRVTEYCAGRGLALERCYQPLPDRDGDRCPVAERVAERTVCLPTHDPDRVVPWAALLVEASQSARRQAWG